MTIYLVVYAIDVERLIQVLQCAQRQDGLLNVCLDEILNLPYSERIIAIHSLNAKSFLTTILCNFQFNQRAVHWIVGKIIFIFMPMEALQVPSKLTGILGKPMFRSGTVHLLSNSN